MARKVLVVDDEKLIVKGIRFSLEQDGMEVECAYDGERLRFLYRRNENHLAVGKLFRLVYGCLTRVFLHSSRYL